MSERLTVVLVAIGLVLAAASLAAQLTRIETPSHDDSISFIAATGHQLEYGAVAAELEGRWAQAGEWQKLWQFDDAPAFRRVARGLAETDVHPPLYFWLLHISCSIFGVSMIWALLVNLVLTLSVAVGVVALARMCRCTPATSWAAALLWLASGASLSVTTAVRPYALLTLCVVLTCVGLIGTLDRGRRVFVVATGLAITAGLLTHFHFSIAVATLGGFSVLVLIRDRRWHALTALVAISLAAAALAWLAHPDFGSSILRLRQQLPTDTELGYRAVRSASSVGSLWLPPSWSRFLGWPVIGMLIFLCFRFRRNLLDRRALPALGGVSILTALVLLYLTGRSPRHAMSAKYLALATPLLCVAIAQAINRGRVAVVVAVVALAGTFPQALAKFRHRAPVPSGPALVGDSIGRGDVPRMLWSLDRDAAVLMVRSGAALPTIDVPSLQVIETSGTDLVESLEKLGYQRVSSVQSKLGTLVQLERPAKNGQEKPAGLTP